jgi:hypothetical protein
MTAPSPSRLCNVLSLGNALRLCNVLRLCNALRLGDVPRLLSRDRQGVGFDGHLAYPR